MDKVRVCMTGTCQWGDCIMMVWVYVPFSFYTAATQTLVSYLTAFCGRHSSRTENVWMCHRCIMMSGGVCSLPGVHTPTQHHMLWRNSCFQSVLTSRLIRRRSRKLELRSPEGAGSNNKPRLMTSPEGWVSHSKSFLSSNLHTSLPSIWHSDSSMGNYGSDITPNLWHHHCPSVILHRFSAAADIWCLQVGMSRLFMSWLEEVVTHLPKPLAAHHPTGGHLKSILAPQQIIRHAPTTKSMLTSKLCSDLLIVGSINDLATSYPHFTEKQGSYKLPGDIIICCSMYCSTQHNKTQHNTTIKAGWVVYSDELSL